MPATVRYTLIAIGLALVAVGGYYRIQSLRSGEQPDRTKEGWPTLIGIRLAGLLTAGLTVAWLWNPARFESVTWPLPDGARWVGVACFACSVAWLLWMFRTLGSNLTDTVVPRPDAKFVYHGPYRIVRNPMYTGLLAAGLSLGLALGTWLIPLAAGLTFTLLALRTPTEERYLIERFGDPYRRYMARTGRFVPKFGRR